MAEYRKVSDPEAFARPLLKSGPVLAWDRTVIFLCPCGEREVAVTQPPHEIKFDKEGRLSLDGSVGSRAKGKRPPNWCHFYVKNGAPRMCEDAQCSGGQNG